MRKLNPAVLVALLLTLTACDPKQITGFTPDSITITIAGLPADLPPDVTITGPGGYQQTLTETTRLEAVAPGAYTVTAGSVAFRGNPFEPDQAVHQLTLEPAGAKSIRIVYAPHRAYSQAVLEHLNAYRQAAGLPYTTMDADGSLPNWLHARYLAENHVGGHEEDPDLPWYTPEGHKAGQRSNVSTTGGEQRQDSTWIMNSFAQAPFHMFNLLDPRTGAVRLGHYANLERSAAALEPIRNASWPADLTVHFPADGQSVGLLAHYGEWPAPATACPSEYRESIKVGLPIFRITGPSGGSDVTATSLTRDGAELEHCVITAATYQNPDPAAEQLARSLLDAYGATIILPQEPLAPLATYTVTLTAGAGQEQWTFHTEDVPLYPVRRALPIVN